MEFERFISSIENPNYMSWINSLFKNRLSPDVSLILEKSQYRIISEINNKPLIIFSNRGRKNLSNKNFNVQEIRETDISIPLPIDDDFSLIYVGLKPKNKKVVIFENNSNSFFIDFDFPIYCSWTLNRIEESQNLNGSHGRFKLEDSHLFYKNFYSRPVIDEWFIFLKSLLNHLGVKTVFEKFDFKISHDVDVISKYKEVPIFRKIITVFSELLKLNFSYFKYISNQKEFIRNESSNTFDWLMSQSEKYGKLSSFYFICGNTSFRYDFRYKLNSIFVKTLMKSIIDRNHSIGIHYSYGASNKNKITREWKKLEKIIKELDSTPIGGRMHYLRIEPVSKSLSQIDKTEQGYDHTLTFYEEGGFRAGTCKGYFLYDFEKNKAFKTLTIPLIVMEGSILGYMNQSHEKAIERFKLLIDQCRKVNGVFSILWHNSDLNTELDKKLYQKVLKYASI